MACQAIVSREGREMVVCEGKTAVITFMSLPHKVPFELAVELCEEHRAWLIEFNPEAKEVPS